MPLNLDENANPVTAESGFAWTATSGSGKLLGATCTDWTAETSDTARIGVFDLTGEGWQFNGTRRCDQTTEAAHLICMETGIGQELDLPGFAEQFINKFRQLR